MMDGLTAIGLAANILQFLEFGTRLLSEANTVYNSASGLSQEYLELQEVAQSLIQLTDSFIHQSDNKSAARSNPSLGVKSDFTNIAHSARVIAEDLIAATNKLTISGCNQKKWRSFRQALLTLWNRDKIECLQKRLENLRGQLSIQVLSHVSKQQATLVTDLNALKTFYTRLELGRNDDVKELSNSLQDLKNMIQETNPITIRKADQILCEGRLALQRYEKERAILESLSFDTMTHRYHAIVEAHQQTFRWIFEPSHFNCSDPRSQIRFKDWLASNDGIYWISGKPGSGKSTLMKYICDSPETITNLRQWAKQSRLATAGFFFWASGTDMQRSQRGLLQQLLFEIFQAVPSLIPILCSQRWHSGSTGDWTISELRVAFSQLEKVEEDVKLCFFIDGLDEYEGDEIELIQTLQSIVNSSRIKLCVSSRPWPCFEDAFGGEADSKLYLHHLTVDDIRQFASDKLKEISYSGDPQQELQVQAKLVDEISRKSHGVFLWVFLVVKSLREGFVNGDTFTLLQARLRGMPSDLEPFFEKLLLSVDQVYLRDMAITFEVAVRSPERMCLLTYWFLDEDQSPKCRSPGGPDFAEIRALEERMIRRLQGRYKGLLEAVGVPGSRKVQFIHRTVHDFLRMRTVHRLFAQPRLDATSKALKALVTHAQYCSINGESRGFNGFNSQDFDYFMIFARWAEKESTAFEWEFFNAMSIPLSGWYDDYNFHILCEAVRFGFTAYLQHRHDRDNRLIQRLSKPLLQAALTIQLRVVNSVFGIQSSFDTLVWLLSHGADPNVETETGTVFKEYVSEAGALARRSRAPWAYEQWQKSLLILLRFGASFNDIFADQKLLGALPQIGYLDDSSINNLTDAELLKEPRLHQGLHRQLDMYSAFFEHGLDPNRRVFSFTLWEVWLWHVCQWQSDHGRLEDICVRAMKLFLAHNADPFHSICFGSERLRGPKVRSVSDIVDVFFTQESGAEIRPLLERAKRCWRQSHPVHSVEDARKRKANYELDNDRWRRVTKDWAWCFDTMPRERFLSRPLHTFTS